MPACPPRAVDPARSGRDPDLPEGAAPTGRLNDLRPSNDVLRFLLELSGLAALALWGYTVGGSVTRWVLAIAVPVAFATLWAVFISPKAARPLDDPARLAAELALFGLAVVALVHADQPRLAVIVGVAVTVHLALTFPLDQR